MRALAAPKGTGNRAAEASVTFPGGADTRERADSPRTGGWSIADFVPAKRDAGEFCFLCFITKEVPARHEGYRLAILQKVNPPGCAGPKIFRPNKKITPPTTQILDGGFR